MLWRDVRGAVCGCEVREGGEVVKFILSFFKKKFGYCEMCHQWFVYPKRRRMNTSYKDEESNYVCVCKTCFGEIEQYWEERWQEYWSERL